MKDTPESSAPAFVRLKLSAETVVAESRLVALEHEWRLLEQGAKGAIFFQSFDWCRFIWRTRNAQREVVCAEPRVIVVRDGDGVVAIWPLAIVRGNGGRFAQDLSEPFGQYSDILLAARTDIDTVMQLALTEIARWRVDGLVLRKVRTDAGLAAWMKARASPFGVGEMAPAVELSAFAGFDDYRRSINAKTRKNLRNYRNRLAREGVIKHAVIDAQPERAAVIERCFLERSDWLETSGRSSSAFADPLFPAVVTGLARAEAGAPAVMAMRLGLEQPDGTDADLSVHWGFIHQGRYYAFMAAKNPEFDDCSPGRLHLEDVIAACSERGVGTVDMLLPAMPYKLTWATTSVGVNGYGLALTTRGRLVIRGWHGLLRPALKSALVALPPVVRKHAMLLLQLVFAKPGASAGKPPVSGFSEQVPRPPAGDGMVLARQKARRTGSKLYEAR